MLKVFNNMKISVKSAIFLGFFVLGFIVFAVISFSIQGKVEVNGPIYNDIIKERELITNLYIQKNNINEAYLIANNISNETDSKRIEELFNKEKILEKSFNDAYDSWVKNLPEGEVKNLLVKDLYNVSIEFYDTLKNDLFTAIEEEKDEEVKQMVNVEMLKLYNDNNKIIENIVSKVESSSNNYEQEAQQTKNNTNMVLYIILFVVIISVAFYFYLMSRTFISLYRIKDILKGLSEGGGDLTKRINIEYDDEIGQLARYFNKFIDVMQNIVRNIYGTTRELGKASTDMLDVSSDLKTSVENASNNINKITEETEKISDSTSYLASSAEQTSSSVANVSDLAGNISTSIDVLSSSSKDVSTLVSGVATAIEDINLSLSNINKNCERSINITSNASEKATNTNSIINKLDMSSKQIEKIVNVINDIADQTNMLALNAAIEAVGAGEAGKGFAVVANEVKELAKQTAEATDEIGEQIDNMQQNISEAVRAMEIITGVVNEISLITNTIASSVTEQSASANDILDSVLKSSQRVSSITNEIVEVAQNSKNTATAISEAAEGTKEIAKTASNISSASSNVVESIIRINQMFNGKSSNKEKLEKNINMTSIELDSSKTNNMAKLLLQSSKKLESLVKHFKI